MIWLRSTTLCLIACMLLAGGQAAANTTPRTLVLIANRDLVIEPLTPTELRRLFLGRPVARNGHTLKPIRNETDPTLYEVFLQKVLFMSARTYEQQIISQVFNDGGVRPPRYTNLAQLTAAVATAPHGISFMWADSVAGLQQLRVVQVVWQESHP